MDVAPLFKSHYSIGKSILTLDFKKEGLDEGSDSIFQIIKEDKIKDLVLVEDSMTGFMQAQKGCESFGLNLIFGLRISVCNKLSDEGDTNSCSKVIIFAKNPNGCRLLNKIFTEASLKGGGAIDYELLLSMWGDDLKLAIPFYDSFIFNNAFSFSNCVPNFGEIRPTFFLEENGLPLDNIILDKVISFCSDSLPTEWVKSIYYNKRSDYDAYVTYKCVCNRKNFMASLDKPKFDHLGSREFCLESWRENNERRSS